MKLGFNLGMGQHKRDITNPVISGSTAVSIAENTTAVGVYTSNEMVTWTLTGADSAFFGITPGPSVSATLAFLIQRDFETPADAGLNNVYNVTVTGTDTALNVGTMAVAVTITDVVETPTDYIITTDAEWDTMMANTAATLSGKTAEIRTALAATTAITDKNFSTKFTIRGGAGGSFRGFTFNGTIGPIEFQDVTFQPNVWASGQLVRFSTGTFNAPIFRRCTLRHGYGASLVDAPHNNLPSIPEIQKPTYSGTATTVSSRVALPAWVDAAVIGGEVKITNNGTDTIYAAVGDSTVVATTALLTTVLAGATRTFDGFSGTLPTHIATITAAGSSGFTGTREQGIVQFMKDGFTASGAATFTAGVEFYDCLFSDVNIAIAVRAAVVDNCHFRRVYQDHIKTANVTGLPTYITRNLAEINWSSSTHAQNPHGDFSQHASTTPAAARTDVIVGGNCMYANPDATDGNQGVFASDYDINPNYVRFHTVGNVFSASPSHGITVGEFSRGYLSKDCSYFGNTVLASVGDINAAGGPITASCGANYSAAWGNIMGTRGSPAAGAGAQFYNNLDLTASGVTRSTVFPNFANLAAANTRALVHAALNPAGAGAGLGLDLDLIDYTTTTLANIVKWANIPSGLHWTDEVNPAVSTLITTVLATVTNARTGQVVTPGSGVEWRSFQNDGTTAVQAWTTSSGTIEPGQRLQIRYTTVATPLTAGSATITINGFAEVSNYTTAAAAPSAFWTVGSGAPNTFLKDTATAYSAARTTGYATIYMPSAPGATVHLFSQATNAWRFQIETSRQITVSARDSANTIVLAGTTVLDSLSAAVVLATGTWITIIFDVNHTAGTVTVTVNGTVHPAIAFTTAGTGLMRTSNSLLIGSSTTGGASTMPSGWQLADVSVSLAGANYKTIPNTAAGVNADAWKVVASANAT